MTLEQAIEHLENILRGHDFECESCRQEHIELLGFLTELKERRADVVPVVHGRWVDGKCSNCGADIPTDDAHDAIFESECHYCYYCGAKMDGGTA